MGEVAFEYPQTGFRLTFDGELDALSHVVGPKFDVATEVAVTA